MCTGTTRSTDFGVQLQEYVGSCSPNREQLNPTNSFISVSFSILSVNVHTAHFLILTLLIISRDTALRKKSYSTFLFSYYLSLPTKQSQLFYFNPTVSTLTLYLSAKVRRCITVESSNFTLPVYKYLRKSSKLSAHSEDSCKITLDSWDSVQLGFISITCHVSYQIDYFLYCRLWFIWTKYTLAIYTQLFHKTNFKVESIHDWHDKLTWNTSLDAQRIRRWAGNSIPLITKFISLIRRSAYSEAILAITAFELSTCELIQRSWWFKLV